MMGKRTSRGSGNSEEARAFLQTRVALFWKVVFFIMLLASAMGAVGPMTSRGPDVIVQAALAAEAGALWWLCRRGHRSVRLLRWIEGGGLLIAFVGGSLTGRYVLVGFARDHGLVSSEGALFADAYLGALGLIGAALTIVVRAALIPSSPRRTIVYTAIVGAPMVLTPTFLVPASHAGLAVRALDSGAYPWLPAALAIVWGFVIVTSTVITRVIYGLRVEVREARQLGQYVIEQKIGEGGMGEVYRARHGMMRRPTALKLLRADAGERNLVRFEREVQLTARLTHPNTITIFDYGRTDDDVFYYAMELLDGANLQRIVEVGGPQAEGRVMRILTMACGALAEAHAIGLIHRDIKPANIMLCTQGGERDVVKVLDFGLVKELKVDGDVGASIANTLAGTPQYMAPESILSPNSVDARTDIYALGAAAYYLLAGSELFDGKSIVEVCSQHMLQEPAPLAARGVTISADLEAVVLACLQKKPDRRPQSMVELRRRLEACAVEPWDGDSARRWWLEHQAALAGDAARSSGEVRTIGVDPASRSDLALAG
jgi:eukaryotic-like serine/threonine-protein kinase